MDLSAISDNENGTIQKTEIEFCANSGVHIEASKQMNRFSSIYLTYEKLFLSVENKLNRSVLKLEPTSMELSAKSKDENLTKIKVCANNGVSIDAYENIVFNVNEKPVFQAKSNGCVFIGLSNQAQYRYYDDA
jgi:hypothetical protein